MSNTGGGLPADEFGNKLLVILDKYRDLGEITFPNGTMSIGCEWIGYMKQPMTQHEEDRSLVSNLQIKSPTRYYGYLVLTSGLFVFYWLISLMRNVNALDSGKPRFNTSLASKIYLIVNIAFFLGVLLIMRGVGSPVPAKVGLIMGLLWLGTIVVSVAWIYVILLQISNEKTGFVKVAKVAFLTLALYLSLPFLQEKVNGLALKNGRAAAPV